MGEEKGRAAIGAGGDELQSNGTLTSDGTNTYSWDADGNSITVSTVSLTFDALDRMVEQHRSTGYTQIVYGPGGGKLALMNGQTLSLGFVPLVAGGTAVYTSGPTLNRYRHPDWLGSARFSSSYNQGMYHDTAYAPYGETYAEAGEGDDSFTGANKDTYAYNPYPLYDFLNREYHPVWGRWVSPDPAGLGAVNPANPQSWNRYAYVMNNPTAFRDPTGLDCYPKWEGNCASAIGIFIEPGLGSTWNEFDLLNIPVWLMGAGTDEEGSLDYPVGSGFFLLDELPLSRNWDFSFLAPQVAVPCEGTVQAAVNSDLGTQSIYLGVTQGMDANGMRGGAYNFNYFAPGVTFGMPPGPGSIQDSQGNTISCGRFDDGLHIPVPYWPCNLSGDPTISNWGPGVYNGVSGSHLTGHIDSSNPFKNVKSFFGHIINNVILQKKHGC
jgi:RHS repeat-associated protein